MEPGAIGALPSTPREDPPPDQADGSVADFPW
jgi:hypothetical protein